MKIFRKLKFIQNKFFIKLKHFALQSVSTNKRLFITLALLNFPMLIYVFYEHPQLTNQHISKTTQTLSQISIPKFLRNYLYTWYCKKYTVNQQQMIKPLDSYRTFRQFFTRKIKERQIKQGENVLCAPADSKILSLREITTDECFLIKGYNYKFGQFICGEEVEFDKNDFDLLKKNNKNKLYQAVFYLSPGDYHRFHAAIDYQIIKRKIINGYLFSVKEKSLLSRRKVYQKNARLVLHGKWKQGYLGMVMVGALNVGKIILNQDKKFKKGDQMGYFSLGSTIVLIIEAKDLEWKAQQGQKIKYGQQFAVQKQQIHQNQIFQQQKPQTSVSIFAYLKKLAHL